ncbi:MAG TPA: pyridoxal phosphate-dependent aminotransferase [Deltaproteobacteria bacterium]|nr:pyridoxal phosphate-dependent aminotransferase [Deltaproteobacteria bacterium]
MTNIPLARNLSTVAPSRIREIADIAFTMDGVFKLHFGESDMPTPAYIKEAAFQAMNEGYTFYSENAGLLSLRKAIARKYSDLHDVKVDPETEIVITASGVQALNVSIRCVIDPGDEAIILSPNWPNATSIVSLYGGRPIEIPYTSNRSRFEIDFDAIASAVTPKTRLLVYTSPSNPLGWVANPSEQQSLLDFCRKHRLWLLADEVYERFYYAGPVAPSILKICSRDDAVIVVHSFSKSYCMTGWRLGWMVARSDLIHKASQLNEFIVSHAPSMIQRAGEIALEKGEKDIESMKDSIQERVNFCFKALSSIESVSLPQPEGAFYLFPRIEGVTDSFSFALSLLKETKVSLAPGVAFGNGGEGAVRICCAADLSVLEPAMERFVKFLKKG